MLNLKSDNILQKSYKKLLDGQLLELAEDVMENLKSSRNDAVELPLKLTIDGRPMSFIMHVNALNDDAGQHMGMVMVFLARRRGSCLRQCLLRTTIPRR